MQSKGLVSIVVPIYNQEIYLDRSVLSLQNQTYKKIEIVLVDDGSTDASLIIINDYTKKRWQDESYS